jgi:nitrous oxidase accessory protein NosD
MKKNFNEVKKIFLLICLTLFLSYLNINAVSISVPTVGIKTIGEAMINAKSGDTVWLSDGIYREHVFVKSGVTLIARNYFKAVVDGNGRGTVITLSTDSKICGLEIRGGTIGVFSKDPGNAIIKCRITKNWGTGIICVRHLPQIEDNIIVFNKASGIQGWDIRSTSASVNHNTIAFNGNNGIAFGGYSEVLIENNLIVFNERMGVKLSSKSENSKLVKNNIYGNLMITRTIPQDNFSFDPKFSSPRTKLDFTIKTDAPCCMYGSDNQIIGSRIADGKFINEGL